MNRREFLLDMGATACSGRAPPVEEPETDTPPPDAPPMIIAEHPSVTGTNLKASPLAIHGDILVQQKNTFDELWVWDLRTMRRVDAFSLPHDAFTLLSDGSIVAFGEREVGRDCAVFGRAKGVLSAYPTSRCETGTLLLRTGSPNSVYSVLAKEIVRFRFGGSKVEADATIEIPFRSLSNYDQVFSLDDGRIVVPSDGIDIVAPGRAAVRRPMGKIYARHHARATAERFWYTRASRNDNALDTLVLAHLDTPHRDLRAVTFAPSRIVHVASRGSAIAILLMSSTVDAQRSHVDKWHVAVVDGAGIERWQAEVPQPPVRWDLNRSAVALSDKRLVLAIPTGVLLAWDAETGASVPVTPPA